MQFGGKIYKELFRIKIFHYSIIVFIMAFASDCVLNDAENRKMVSYILSIIPGKT